MLKAAVVECDITPEKGEDLCGFAMRTGPVSGIHDRLKCRWLSLKSGKASVLIGSCDVLSFSQEFASDLAAEIKSDTGSRVAITCTHTHSGPATVPLKRCGDMDARYMGWLRARMKESAVAAVRSQHRPAKALLARGESDWAFNRRERDGGVADHEILTLVIADAEGEELLAAAVNYACHPVVLGHENNGVSADYPGYLTAAVAEAIDAPCLFLNGACGNINPRNEHMSDPAEAKLAGETIAVAALDGLEDAEELTGEDLHWLEEEINIPVYQPESAEFFAQRFAQLQETFPLAREIFESRLGELEDALATGSYPKTVPLKLTLLSIGSEFSMLLVPGEVFAEIGLQLKTEAAPATLMVVGYSNGSVGYLCTKDSYQQGGYEPNFANLFYDFPEFDPTVEDVVLEGARRLLRRRAAAVEESSREL